MTFDPMSGLMSYGVFVFSVTLHEAAHAWAGLKLGDRTAAEGGQVTLDPIPHIRRSPFGMVVAPILSWLANGAMIGWASAPFDPTWARARPKRKALVSAAGPASNFLLVILAGILIRLGLHSGVFRPPAMVGWYELVAGDSGLWVPLAGMLSLLFNLNLLLGLFNLIPLPPLDGGSILLLFLPERSAGRFMDFLHQPGLMILGLLVAWKLFGQIFWPVWGMSLRWLFGAW